MSTLPTEASGDPVASGANIKNAIQQAMAAAAINAGKSKLPGEAAAILDQAQQALNFAPPINKASPGPGINGINGQVPFEQLSTAEATQIAMAAIAGQQAGAIPEAIEAFTVPRIATRVSINGQAISEVLSLQIHQEAGAHNRLELRFFHDEVQAQGSLLIDGAEKLLGQVAEVELYDSNGIDPGKLQNLFVVADVQLEQDTLNEGVLHITGYAPTWLLDGQPHFETFYKKNLNTIVKESTSRSLAQVKASLKADATLSDTLPFVCRYHESVWNFLKRLSAGTGQWLYFNGRELLFGKPEARNGPDIVYGQNCSRINMSMKVQPVQQGLFDYEADNHQAISAAADSYNGNAGTYTNIAFGKSKELFGTILSVSNQGLLPARQATLEAMGKSISARSAAGMYYVTGETTVFDLSVGLNVNVALKRKDQTAQHTPVRIIAIEHHWEITGQYYNRFTAIPAAAEVPPELVYIKPVTYPMLAKVIDNHDVQGRVRVQFMGWQQESGIPETDFIRVLTPDAGGAGDKVATNRGLVTIPEIGDQVYVDWEGGNTDRPFVTGSVFHGKVGVGGGSGNDGKSLTTKSGHTLTMHDGGGISLIDKSKLNHIKIDGNNKITVTAGANVTLTNGSATISMIGGKISIQASESIDLQAPQITMGSYGGEHPTTQIDVKAQNITQDAETNITHTSPLIDYGKPEGTLNLGAATVNVNGSTEVNISAPVINAN
ncbi:phage baseplate assembly protein V [Taibaiella koreensis]|uniref:phage baseplate assembly protein V n=1 Tax=Taibaiella koreensis TaxID=1268548 RepID=UPI000E599AB5|nr:phage baseplate assembly protein V [Taibaiella koreensis]